MFGTFSSVSFVITLSVGISISGFSSSVTTADSTTASSSVLLSDTSTSCISFSASSENEFVTSAVFCAPSEYFSSMFGTFSSVSFMITLSVGVSVSGFSSSVITADSTTATCIGSLTMFSVISSSCGSFSPSIGVFSAPHLEIIFSVKTSSTISFGSTTAVNDSTIVSFSVKASITGSGTSLRFCESFKPSSDLKIPTSFSVVSFISSVCSFGSLKLSCKFSFE